METLKLGNPLETGTQMGPQADGKQAEAIAKYLDIGLREGVALTGGKKATDKGENFITPTVFTGLSDTSKLNVEEIFGPVLVLHEFDTEEEAVRRANDTECKFLLRENLVYRDSQGLTLHSQTVFTPRFSPRTSIKLFVLRALLKPET